MKVFLFAFASSFTEGLSYKENYYTSLFVKLGYEVIVFSNNSSYLNGNLVQENESDISSGLLRVIKRKYQFFLTPFLSSKIRKFKNLKKSLLSLKPDIIFSFGLQSYDMLTLASYKKYAPKCLFIAESHEDSNNSARTFLSKWFLHKLFYQMIIKKVFRSIDKLYYITSETKFFLKKMYGIDGKKLFYSPLGGNILSDFEWSNIRQKVRNEFSFSDKNIVFLHSGKLNFLKKTIPLIINFTKVNNPNLKLIIAGSVDENISNQFFNLISQDSRIYYLGWVNAFRLKEIICASDVYIQPGSQSATLQVAACLRCAVITAKHESYFSLFKNNIIYIENDMEMHKLIEQISINHLILNQFKASTYSIACDLLDYESQVKLIISQYDNLNKVS